jgi:hypothetical protein
MPSFYHSALDPDKDAPPLSGFTRENGTAFVHDIMTDDFLPDAYKECDVLYGDPPWKRGYQVFTERCCIKEPPSYDTFMFQVADLIERSGLPAVMVAGKQAAKYFDGYTAVPVRLQRFEAIAYYKDLKPVPTSSAAGILEGLAKRFDTVGDFFAGYGAAPRAFTLAGKRFVASDCNPGCISIMQSTLPPLPTRR